MTPTVSSSHSFRWKCLARNVLPEHDSSPERIVLCGEVVENNLSLAVHPHALSYGKKEHKPINYAVRYSSIHRREEI